MNTLDECTHCGASTLRPLSEPETRTIDGVSVTTTVHGFACDACGERYYDAASLEAAEDAETDALVAAGVPGARSFQWVRKALGLRASELARLLDVTPESLSRWENGSREVPRYARAILATLWLERQQHAAASLRAVLERLAAA